MTKITIFTILGLLNLIMVLSGCQSSSNAAAAALDAPHPTDGLNSTASAIIPNSRHIEEEWGIRIEGLRLSAADYMLDLRYQVTDPKKALPIVDQKIKPYLVDQQSGAVMAVPSTPKAGSLRNTPERPEKGKTYFILFANPNKFIKAGNKVTVVVGDFKVENMIVQ